VSKIVLCTVNARYIHTAFGLRYLHANMGDLAQETVIREFTLEVWPADIVEQLLREAPDIIGFGVYIWNLDEITRVVALLKTVRPDVTVILGGPEVGFETDAPPVVSMADYVVTGQADLCFARVCRQLIEGRPPASKVLAAPLPDLKSLVLPYDLYTGEDIASRVIYVEASRGCPFKCEFCLSALDRTAWAFDLDRFLPEMQGLYDRGARRFKFVDRTFNLHIDSAIAVLEFFLARMDERLFLHFEVIPDRLPSRLKAILARFPPGSLQLEVGIQTFDPETQSLVSRRQDSEKTRQNLQWLRQHSHAHLHADLIVGLPGEDIGRFARGFDELVALEPQEIQVGVLKRLRGSPICRHTERYGMRYNPNPPYNILSTGCIDFPTMQRLVRFARYWDLIANSGRFRETLPLILGDSPFRRFLGLSDWLYQRTGRLHRIALKRLFDLLWEGLTTRLGGPPEAVGDALARDWAVSGLKGRFAPGGEDQKAGPPSVVR